MNKSLVVFELEEVLADTASSEVKDSAFYTGAAVIPSMSGVFKQYLQNPNYIVAVISKRSLDFYTETWGWLNRVFSISSLPKQTFIMLQATKNVGSSSKISSFHSLLTLNKSLSKVEIFDTSVNDLIAYKNLLDRENVKIYSLSLVERGISKVHFATTSTP